jgi:hypothetical protein
LARAICAVIGKSATDSPNLLSICSCHVCNHAFVNKLDDSAS